MVRPAMRLLGDALDQDLGRGLWVATLTDELDGAVQIGLAAGKSLGERKRITGLHQHMEAPALDLRALAPVWFDDFGRLGHGVDRSFAVS
jgi:hypothetical protein